MSTISEHNHDPSVDLSEVDYALREAACPGCIPHSRSLRTRLKQRQFFGGFPYDGGSDQRAALGIPKSSLGVLNDKATMAVPGPSSPPSNPFPVCHHN